MKRATRGRGLSESTPLLLFGATCLGLALYSLLFHTVTFAGRIPLWSYLAGLGGIALAGGLISATVPDELEGMPHAGDRLEGDLIVVPYAEWRELKARAGTKRAAPEVRDRRPEAEARNVALPQRPVADRAPPRATGESRPAVTPRPSPHTPPDWWDAAVRAAREDGLLPPDGSRPSASEATPDFREVLDTLDSIAAEASAPAAPAPRPHADDSAPATPSPPLVPTVEGPSEGRATVNRSLGGPAPEEELESLTRELAALAARPAAATSRERGRTCASCGVSAPGGGASCESCGRALCRSCHDRAIAEGHGVTCSVCAMLLGGSEL